MYCGSCLRDNALAAALLRRGHDVVLMPVYTPTTTDEPNVSNPHVFFGGVSVFLCGNPPTVPPATFPQPPACPLSPATITGVLTPAHVVGPAAQGIAPSQNGVDEFDELVDAILSGATYANVHSAKFPGGEIRGQVRTDERHGDH